MLSDLDLNICSNSFLIHYEGTVEVANLDTATSDPFTPIERLSAGDYFGDIAVLLNAPRAADARAVTAIELYVLKKSDFIDVISRFPDLQKRFKVMAENSLNNLKLKVIAIL
jgi:F-box/leucine-rich repeat protein 7